MSELEPEPEELEEPEEEPELEPEEAEIEGRCEAVTTAGGTEYRCALQAEHDGEHSFQAVEASDTAAVDTVSTDEAKYRARITGYLLKNHSARYKIDAANDLLPCPLCSYTATYGYLVHQQLPFQVEEAVKQIFGWRSLLDYETDDEAFAKCTRCNGRGQVRTHSEVAGNELRKCKKCGGAGYLELDPGGTPVASVPLPGAPPADNGAPAENSPYDEWGTPSWHPDYGKTLQYRIEAVEHWKVNLPTSPATG